MKMKDKPQGYAHLTAKIYELKRELAEAKEQLRLCNVDQFTTAAELADAVAKEREYICKCGLRVVPHQCKTDKEF